MIHRTTSDKETKSLAKKLAKKYKNGATFALIGSLGAGKTTFVQGFAEGLGIKDKILSPTFILIREYLIPKKTNGKLFHLDLYRLDNIHQIESLGIAEIFSNPNNIILIEWAEKLGDLLPKKVVSVQLKILSENIREIKIIEGPRAASDESCQKQNCPQE